LMLNPVLKRFCSISSFVGWKQGVYVVDVKPYA
jgi:hypothetical protein